MQGWHRFVPALNLTMLAGKEKRRRRSLNDSPKLVEARLTAAARCTRYEELRSWFWCDIIMRELGGEGL
jgi:hypothetical protein